MADVTISVADFLTHIATQTPCLHEDNVTLVDTPASFQALTQDQIALLDTMNVDRIDLGQSPLILSFDQYEALMGTGVPRTAGPMTLTGSGVQLESYDAGDVFGMVMNGVAAFDVGEDAIILQQDVVDTMAQGDLTLVSGPFTVAATTDWLEAYSVGEVLALGMLGCDVIDVGATNDQLLSFSVASSLVQTGITLVADVVTVDVSASDLEDPSYQPAQFQGLAGIGVDRLDLGGDDLVLSATKAAGLAASGMEIVGAGAVSIVDTVANILALSAFELAALGDAGVKVIEVTGGDLALGAEQAVAIAESGMSVTGGAFILTDTADVVGNLTVEQVTALVDAGLAQLSVGADTALDLAYGQAAVLIANGVTVTADHIEILDTSDNLSGISAALAEAMKAFGIDTVTVTQGALDLEDAQSLQANGISVVADEIRIVLTAAQLEGLDAAGIAGLADIVTTIVISDPADGVELDLSQAQALAAKGIAVDLDGGSNVVLTAAAAINALDTAQIADLGHVGVTVIDAGAGDLSFDVAQVQAFAEAEIGLFAHQVTVSDSAAALEALSADEFFELLATGVRNITVAGTGPETDLDLTFDQADILVLNLPSGLTFTAGTLTIVDTAAKLNSLDPISLASRFHDLEVDAVIVTEGAISLASVVFLTSGHIEVDCSNVAMSSDNLEAISPNDILEFGANFPTITTFTITDPERRVDLSLEQVQALAEKGIHVDVGQGGSLIVATDHGALDGLTAAEVADLGDVGVTEIDIGASDLTLDAARAGAFASAGIAFQAGSVTVADTGAALATLTAVQIAALEAGNVGVIDATDDHLALTDAQLNALGTISLTMDDEITLRDSGAQIGALTEAQIGALSGQGVEILASSGTGLVLSLAQFNALGTVALAADDVVTVTATPADLTEAAIADFGARHVDVLDVGDVDITISAAQIAALAQAGVRVAAGSVTFEDSAEAISVMTPASITGIAAAGVTVLKAGPDGDGDLTLSASKAMALAATSMVLDAGLVTVSDTGDEISQLTAAQIAALAAKGVDVLDSSTNTLSLSKAQLDALGTVALANDEVVTLRDTGANVGALGAADLQTLAGHKVASIDVVDDALALSLAQFNALGTVTLTAADKVTVADAGSTLSSLSTAEIAALAAKGIDWIDASGNTIVFSAAQLAALGSVGLSMGDNLRVNGGNARDVLNGKASNDTIYGLRGNDALAGGDGADRLYGGDGKDVLTGGSGTDIFVFNSKVTSANVDKVVDFNVADDGFWLDNKYMTKLDKKAKESKPVKLNKKFFAVGSHSNDANDFIIYDKKKGVLYYDQDGNGAKAALKIATLHKNLKISEKDFWIV